MLNTIIIISLLLLIHYSYFLIKVSAGLRKLRTYGNGNHPEFFVSIIIPFRNESGNILKNLASIEAQNYPEERYEVLYVNDFSDDDSLEKITNIKKSDNIKILDVPVNFSLNAHKKRAIRYGIENSKGDIIITTDADCEYDKEWLSTIISLFDEQTGFVSGPVKFKENGSVFGKLQKLEFAGLVLTGAGLIGSDSPTICNAANIAYRRNAFKQVNGFTDQMNLSSGDDELLMQKIFKKTGLKIKFCWDQKAVVTTDPNNSFQQFYQQRKRWASKGLFYADKLLILKLILIFLFYLSVPLQFIFTFTWSSLFIYTLCVSLSVKYLFEYLIIQKGKNFLISLSEMKFFALAEVMHIPYIIVAGISGLFGNYTWKQRKVRR